jgi:hypothetical protein
MSIFDSQVSKREIIETQIEHIRLSFLDRQSSDQNPFPRGSDGQSSEQNNRKLISLHNNGEDEKTAHGFAEFYLLRTYFDLKHACIA